MCTTTVLAEALDPERITARNCSARRILRCPGSTRVRERLGRQTNAALAPTGGQDGATGPSAHPGAETMRASTAPVVGLEGALHEVSSLGESDMVRES